MSFAEIACSLASLIRKSTKVEVMAGWRQAVEWR